MDEFSLIINYIINVFWYPICFEVKEKTDKSHSTQQQALNQKQLDEARLAKIKKLVSD